MIELTERHLRIPAVWARKLGRGDPLLEDDLESAGMVALARAAQTYDPAQGAKPESYLMTCVKRGAIAARNAHDCEKRGGGARPVSLDSPLGDDGADRHGLVGQEAPPEAALEAAEELRRTLRRLPPIPRAVVLLAKNDAMPLKDIGERLGITASRAQQILAEALERLRRGKRTRDGWEAAGRRPGEGLAACRNTTPVIGDKCRRRGIAVVRTRRQARRALGVVKRATAWYLADHAARTLYGEWGSAADALAAVGIRAVRGPKGGGRPFAAALLGWPDLPAAAADVLAALLAQGPAPQREIARRTGLGATGVSHAIRALYPAGWINPPNAIRGDRLNRTIYHALPKALAERERTTALVPTKGLKADLLAAEGWSVLPLHMLPGRLGE